jgi:hypothetical protein
MPLGAALKIGGGSNYVQIRKTEYGTEYLLLAHACPSVCVSVVAFVFWEAVLDVPLLLAATPEACAEALPLPVLEVNKLWKKL